MRRLAMLMTGIAIVASACGGSSQGMPRTLTGTVVVANFNSFSGPNADFGPEQYAGCYAAIQLINRAGGALGHSLDCSKVDSQGEQVAGELAAQSVQGSTPNLVGVSGAGSNHA